MRTGLETVRREQSEQCEEAVRVLRLICMKVCLADSPPAVPAPCSVVICHSQSPRERD